MVLECYCTIEGIQLSRGRAAVLDFVTSGVRHHLKNFVRGSDPNVVNLTFRLT